MTQQRSPYDLPEVGTLSIGILGGTGDQGKGLARRFGLAGHKVIIGSRNAERAQEAAASLGLGETASGADNATVATTADVVIVAVPWDGHKATLESLRTELAGKIVIDCVNPMGFDKQGAYALPAVFPRTEHARQDHDIRATNEQPRFRNHYKTDTGPSQNLRECPAQTGCA